MRIPHGKREAKKMKIKSRFSAFGFWWHKFYVILGQMRKFMFFACNYLLTIIQLCNFTELLRNVRERA